VTSLRRQALLLAAADLRAERRIGEVIWVAIPFGVLALLVIPMAIGIETVLLARLGSGLFWVVVLLFGLGVTQRQTASGSSAHDDTLRLLGVDPAARFIGRSLASAALLFVFAITVGFATLVLYDPPIPPWWLLLAVVALATAGLAMVGTITGAVARGIGSRTTLAPLLAAPLAIPILLGATQAMEGMRQGAGILRWMLLLALVDTLVAVAGVLTARPLEEAAG
jgi:heme exporter protein B